MINIDIILKVSWNIILFLQIMSIIIIIYMVIKNRKMIFKTVKQMFEIITTKEFWKYAISLKWLFK